jgi:hypothetical protein
MISLGINRPMQRYRTSDSNKYVDIKYISHDGVCSIRSLPSLDTEFFSQFFEYPRILKAGSY